MSPADLTATLAALHAAGVRWTLTGGGMPVPGSKPGVVIGDDTRAMLAALRPHRDQLATLAITGRCPGCGVHAMPPLQVCYWCQRGRSEGARERDGLRRAHAANLAAMNSEASKVQSRPETQGTS